MFRIYFFDTDGIVHQKFVPQEHFYAVFCNVSGRMYGENILRISECSGVGCYAMALLLLIFMWEFLARNHMIVVCHPHCSQCDTFMFLILEFILKGNRFYDIAIKKCRLHLWGSKHRTSIVDFNNGRITGLATLCLKGSTLNGTVWNSQHLVVLL
jgi:hypothetical protein